MKTQQYRYKGIGMNAEHIASLTQAEWIKEASGEYTKDLGASTKADEITDLKAIYAECCNLVKGEEKAELVVKPGVPKNSDTKEQEG